MSESKRRVRPGRPGLNRIEKTVDAGADRAEHIHKRIAALPFDVIGEAGPLEDAVKRVREIQDRSIHAVYQLVRDINHEVVRFARDVLPPPRRRAASRKKAAAASRERAKRTQAA